MVLLCLSLAHYYLALLAFYHTGIPVSPSHWHSWGLPSGSHLVFLAFFLLVALLALGDGFPERGCEGPAFQGIDRGPEGLKEKGKTSGGQHEPPTPKALL